MTLVFLLTLVFAIAACGSEETAVGQTDDESEERSTRQTSSPNPEASERSSLPSDRSTSPGSSSQRDGVSDGEDAAEDSTTGPTPTPTPLPEFPDEAVDGDYDHDDDGLIEIRTLAQLDAVRLDPEGTGFVQKGRDPYFAAFPGTGGPSGCPNQTCAGYELAAHLDFDTNGNGEADPGDEYWNDGAGWEPLPGIPEGVEFDGNGYTIHNLFINGSDVGSNVALFTSNSGRIANLNLNGVRILGARVGAALVDRNVGVVHKCTATGNVFGSSIVIGGLVGDNSGIITSSEFKGDVSASLSTDGRLVGGLVGQNRGTIENSISAGEVHLGDKYFGGIHHSATREQYAFPHLFSGYYFGKGPAGGLVGRNTEGGTVKTSTSSSEVSGSALVGGLVGQSYGRVADSVASGEVSGAKDVGGLVGRNEDSGIITNSEAQGRVSGIVGVGGLVGINENAVNYSVAAGQVTGSRYVGGLIGQSVEGTVSRSTASGDVAGGEHVGGLIGQIVEGTVSGSTASGDVAGGEHVGGLIGQIVEGTVSGSTAGGRVRGITWVGGLVGSNTEGTINDGSASGKVSGLENVGGLAGYNRGSISASDSTGDVEGVTYRGTLVGVNDGGNIANSEGSGKVSLNEDPPSLGDREVVASIFSILSEAFEYAEDDVLYDEDGRAVALYISSSHLATDYKLLPPEIVSLSHLEWLIVERRHDIPPEIDNLTDLKVMSFTMNGQIPPEVGNLDSLISLEIIHQGDRPSQIPPQLGNLTNLGYLRLGGAYLQDEIPPELGNLTNLKSLLLQAFSLRGEIPPELGNLTNLRFLYIGDNVIGGCVPIALQEAGVSIQFFGTDHLPFCPEETSSKKAPDPAPAGSVEGSTPAASGQSPASGQGSPAAPDNPADRNVLVDLYLGTGGNSWIVSSRTNWLSSQLMGQWAGVTTEGGYVTGLDLGSSNLAGPFPERLGELSRLRSANLRGNQLTGCIPYNQRLRNALSDSYQSNPAAGQEPGWDLVIANAIYNVIVEHGGLEAIRDPQVSLGWNDFLEQTYGLGLAPCPPPLPNVEWWYDRQSAATDRQTMLAVRNHFTANGTPESSFASWQGEMRSDSGVGIFRRGWRGVTLNGEGRVVKLWLDERQLQGEIPPQLGSLGQLVELNMSKNELTGPVPPELGHLRNLRLLALNQNFTPKASGASGAADGLGGMLPPHLGHLGELRRLVLDDNPFLVGELPLELGNLTNLEHINLQDTGFSGCLPPPLRQNFSPTLGSLLNEVVQDLTIGRVKLLMTDEIGKLVQARDIARDLDDILDYHDETFDLLLEYAPLNQALDEVSRAIGVVSLDTIFKPGSTLSNLGNVKLTC